MDNNDNIIVETQMGNDIKLNNKSRKKKFIIIGLLAFIVVLTITIITGLLITRKPYYEPIELYFDFNNSEIEQFAPDEYWYYAADKLGVSKKVVLDEYNDKLKLLFRNGDKDKQKISYTILEKTKFGNEIFNKVKKDLKDSYGIEEKFVKKCYSVKLEYIGKNNDKSQGNFYVVKIRSDWYLLGHDSVDYTSGNVQFMIDYLSKIVIDFPDAK